ncbi:hypothetical protein NPIL_87041 [Nephila pilipes]|uniref:Uncharacterized protein n=1 Tax=Nephila pilipes TaxID=299642 RepID=A0A8X6N7S0_NEPPI|nr:hypothetical protein NPIL_87041 [Nephila pilipes]
MVAGIFLSRKEAPHHIEPLLVSRCWESGSQMSATIGNFDRIVVSSYHSVPKVIVLEQLFTMNIRSMLSPLYLFMDQGSKAGIISDVI